MAFTSSRRVARIWTSSAEAIAAHLLDFFGGLLFPAFDIAIAIACFCGFPAAISVLMFSEITFLDFPDFNGIFGPQNLDCYTIGQTLGMPEHALTELELRLFSLVNSGLAGRPLDFELVHSTSTQSSASMSVCDASQPTTIEPSAAFISIRGQTRMPVLPL